VSKIASDETKQIPLERWDEWCIAFTDGNRGRMVGIELSNVEFGAQPLTEEIALVAINYDPPDKGNNFVLSYGEEAAPSRHVIEGPVVLWQAQDKNGRVMALEIEDERGTSTIITFA